MKLSFARHRTVRFAVLAGLLLAGACRRSEPSPTSGGSVLLVVIDTLRADKLGCYGDDVGRTPRIDALAARSLLFENASSHAPWTLPATASLLTSRYPRQHGAGGRVPDFTALAPGVETVAERFGAAGAHTALVANVTFLDEPFGLTRGFQHVDVRAWEDNRHLRHAAATTDAALEWLAQEDGAPFFLMVHYFDCHATYDPPQPFRRRFAAPEDRETDFAFGTREQMVGLRTGAFRPGASLVRRAEALYDGEVAYTDQEVGRLLDGLDALGLGGTTLVALTADHGEEFRDHGGLEHGHTLYAELLHVPLLLRVPGVPAARIVAGVGQVDVAPTLCAWAGVAPGAGFVGTDLLPLASASAPRDRDVLAHGNFWGAPLTSLRAGEHKLILTPGAAPRLFRWKTDPREQRDLAGRAPEVVADLQRELERLEQRLEAGEPPVPVELSAEALRGLEALGYVGGEERKPNREEGEDAGADGR